MSILDLSRERSWAHVQGHSCLYRQLVWMLPGVDQPVLALHPGGVDKAPYGKPGKLNNVDMVKPCHSPSWQEPKLCHCWLR